MELLDSEPSLLALVALTWPAYILPSLFTLPPLFWREKRLPWTWPDILVVLGPWLIWMFLFLSTSEVERKLIHALIESFVMGCATPAGLGAIILGKGRLNAVALRISILVVAGMLAMVLCTWFFYVIG